METIDTWMNCPSAEPLSRLPHAAVVKAHGLRVVATDHEIQVFEVKALLSFLSSFVGVSKATPTIYDLRSLDFRNVTSSIIKQWVRAGAKHADLQRTQGAFVVPNSLGFGMMRMFQILNEVNGIAPESRLHVTYSIADAANWARAYRDRCQRVGDAAPMDQTALH